jgi:hypothetical protein
MVKTSKSDFELDEFLAMLPQGLNALFLYAPWFSKLLNIARTNPTVLAALQGMGQINYTGAALNPEDEIWATEQGIPVTVYYSPFNCCANTDMQNTQALYATTETGAHHSNHLLPFRS